MNNNSNMDEHTKSLLSRFTVVKQVDKPKFIPYTEYKEINGEVVEEHHSPFTDFMYNSKLPEVYRSYDKPLGKPFYRFLQSIFEGGFAPLVNKFGYNEVHDLGDIEKTNLGGIENLLELVDPEKCPDKFLPYYCRSFGLEWFPDLATTEKGKDNHDYYNRTFLCNIGEIIKRRGTESCIKYVAKVLTGMNVDIRYSRVFNPDRTTKARIIWVNIKAETPEDISKVGINSDIIRRYIESQIPYYITSVINYNLNYGAKSNMYHSGYVKSVATKTIRCGYDVGDLARAVGTNKCIGYKVISNVHKKIRPNK